MIHGYWLKKYGIEGEYIRREVKPDELAEFVSNLAKHGFVGANVTIPHKEAVVRFLNRGDLIVHALNAANTLWLEDGQLRGTNTDSAGFLAYLDECLPEWDREKKNVVVLGAGGAARAVAYGLTSRWLGTLSIVNRDQGRAKLLAEDLNIDAKIHGYDALPSLLRDTDILVNTTSLGMKGQPPLDIDLSPLKQSAAVYDLVYVPLETALLRQARERGLVAIDGLGMLLHQAAPGFEKWFGVFPEVTPELRALLVADLEKDAPK